LRIGSSPPLSRSRASPLTQIPGVRSPSVFGSSRPIGMVGGHELRGIVSPTASRLVVAANRLPVRWSEKQERWTSSPGGLVSALAPILRERGGVWIGWTGATGGEVERFEADGIHNLSVPLDASELDDHYYGFCNGTIWPLYHDAIRPPEFHRHWWRSHLEVNQRFADAVVDVATEDDLIWIHDYQLQLVPAMVRAVMPRVRIGFFLHIPFPPPEIFERLPWRRPLLEGLLGADYLGFQTRRAALNFAAAAREFAWAWGSAGSLRHEYPRLLCVPGAVS